MTPQTHTHVLWRLWCSKFSTRSTTAILPSLALLCRIMLRGLKLSWKYGPHSAVCIDFQPTCTQYNRQLTWCCCLSVYLFVTLCSVTKRYIVQQSCLNKWIGSAPTSRKTILQLSTHYIPTLYPKTPHPCMRCNSDWNTERLFCI